MLADYHVHTPYCGHARGKIIDYVHSAVDFGLQEIGFADHLERYYLTPSQRRRYWNWGMEDHDLDRYVAELLELRDVFAEKIAIKIGIEADYVEGAEEMLSGIVNRFPLDFILCSIHCIPQLGWKHLADYSSQDSSLVFRDYFRLARAAMKTGLFNVLAHMDFIWRYIPWPAREPTMPFEEIARTVATARECGTVVEINANGYLWSRNNTIDEGDPFEAIVDQCRRYGVPVSLGSDAHDPLMVAKLFPELCGMLQQKGFSSFTCFSEGKARREKLG